MRAREREREREGGEGGGMRNYYEIMAKNLRLQTVKFDAEYLLPFIVIMEAA